MHQTNRPSLTNTLLVLPMLAATHLISACNDTNNKSTPQNLHPDATPQNSQTNVVSRGTTAVSPEALFDFLYVATRFEFWDCSSSDDEQITFISLDSKDDETDEGFNPLMLLGLLREPQLEDDPRALDYNDRENSVELSTTPVSFAVTSADSISVIRHGDKGYAAKVDDTSIFLTNVRTGPGRAFTAVDKVNKTDFSCTADNVGASIMP